MCHGPSAKPFGLGIVFFFFCSDSCIGIPNRLAWWFFFWISKTIAVFIGDEAIGATTPTEPPTFHSLGSLEGTFQIRLSIDDNGVVIGLRQENAVIGEKSRPVEEVLILARDIVGPLRGGCGWRRRREIIIDTDTIDHCSLHMRFYFVVIDGGGSVEEDGFSIMKIDGWYDRLL
ncbi:unnamed protein product, partial [Vitis vinifera]|uniref:Uncharacterized protein n=1 Tax=Vitis vinifera TaxID=29760 RepID=D7STG5_VITVI